MKIISLGWGVQSMTLAVMAALGDIEPVDYAIHSDTTHERSKTYDYALRWTRWLEDRGVKVVTVKDDKAPQEVWQGKHIPSHTNNGVINGMALRTCTQRWKIAPMRKIIQELRNGEKVYQLMGISLDEVQRMKQSEVKYIENIYPLVDLKMSRWDCKLYLERNGIDIPPRSACVFCPFHSRAEWRDIRDNAPEDWNKAVKIDHAIRKARPPYDLFVNVQRKPLDECDLDNEIDKGQLSLWDNECDGICGV
jgi:3'-phosphoadenosine 5'-phosphosulfate sulfotransferase (PAPS reductase)/FAD synthetase